MAPERVLAVKKYRLGEGASFLADQMDSGGGD